MHTSIWTKLSTIHGLGWWVEIAIWIALACLLWWGYHRTYQFLFKRFSKIKKTWPINLLQSLNRPVILFLWFVFITWIWQKIEKEVFAKPLFTHWFVLYKVVAVLTLFAIVMSFIHYMQKSLLKQLPRSERTKTNKTSVIAVAQLLRLITIVLLILMLLQVTGIPVSALLAIGGMGTVAIGFAAKDTLENYMGGAMIFFDRPFGVGDWIKLPTQNIEGTVEQIGWRLTKVIAFDKQPFYVPNRIFSNVIIINPSRMTNRRIRKTVGVRYQDYKVVAPIVEAIQVMLDNHEDLDHSVTTFVNLVELNESSLDILVYAFTKTTNWVEYQGIQQTVLLEIVSIITQHGAECAFPTRTLDVPDPVMMTSSNKKPA